MTDKRFIDHRLSALPSLNVDDDHAREARHALLASLLGAYADGELPAETVSQIDAHLVGCQRCRNELRVQRALGERLAHGTIPTASSALHDRIRRSVAAAPPVRPTNEVARGAQLATIRRLVRYAVGVLVLVAVALLARQWASRGSVRNPARVEPVALGDTPPLLQELVSTYRSAARGDLPGRARDLERVRQAVGFPVYPLESADAHLVSVWTVTVDGELAAALAYRWRDQLVIQFVVAESAVFRARDLRAAFAEQRLAAVQADAIGVVTWSEPSAGAVILAEQPWRGLLPLAPSRLR
ncbi:MAG: zf-HC2 domain-containing protein [Gemmatimonadaceae bacterium]|nr:zf-HC2 domain-containing protein [Gemmatimonadaceae bacterium]